MKKLDGFYRVGCIGQYFIYFFYYGDPVRQWKFFIDGKRESFQNNVWSNWKWKGIEGILPKKYENRKLMIEHDQYNILSNMSILGPLGQYKI